MFIIDARDTELAEVQSKLEWLEQNPQPCMVLIQSADDEAAIKRALSVSFSGVRWVVTPRVGARGVRLPVVAPAMAQTEAGQPVVDVPPAPVVAVAAPGATPLPAVAPRFPALRLIAGLLKLLALLIVTGAILTGLVAVGLAPPEKDRSLIVLSSFAGLVVSALLGLPLWGLAEMLLVLIAIEENTRMKHGAPSA